MGVGGSNPLAPTNLEKLAALTFSERPFFVLAGLMNRSEVRTEERIARRQAEGPSSRPDPISFLAVRNWLIAEQELFEFFVKRRVPASNPLEDHCGMFLLFIAVVREDAL